MEAWHRNFTGCMASMAAGPWWKPSLTSDVQFFPLVLFCAYFSVTVCNVRILVLYSERFVDEPKNGLNSHEFQAYFGNLGILVKPLENSS